MILSKKILIFGGTGSLGNALTKTYLENNEIIIFSRGENNQFIMKNKFNNHKNLKFMVGDIRDRERVETSIFQFKPNIIIIAAALKHIDVCEYNINECINTNIEGIKNIINIITSYAINSAIPFLECVCFISTDKACLPVNTYGMCKAVSERIVIEKTNFILRPKFVIVRYGNVLSSNGSLIPFYKNISKDKKDFFPVTDSTMTRFFMKLEDSVKLIEYAITFGCNGDTIIPKVISSYKIIDIANYFSNKFNIPIKITGIRPGEKIHEMLISFTESLRTVETEKYYIIKPTYYPLKISSVNFTGDGYTSSSNVSELDEIILSEINN